MKTPSFVLSALLLCAFANSVSAQNSDLSIISVRSAAKDSISISLKNTNTAKKLHCKKIDVAASIAGPDQCGVNEVWSDGFHFSNVTFNADETIPKPNLGKDILEDVKKRISELGLDDSELNYCELKSVVSKDCGYTCDDDGVERMYDEEVELVSTEGTIKRICRATGKMEVAEARCNDPSRYILAPDNRSCMPKPCEGRTHGEPWTLPVINGVQSLKCDFGATLVTGLTCNSASFEPVGTAYCQARSVLARHKGPEFSGECGQISTQRDVFKPFAPFLESQIYGNLPGGLWGVAAPSCAAGQFLVNSLNFATPEKGTLAVTFHFSMNVNGTISQLTPTTPLVEFDLYSPSYNNLVFANNRVSFSDLGPNSTGLITGPDSTIDNLAALPATSLNPAIYSWKMVTLQVQIPAAISDIKPRVKILHPMTSLRLAGIDIQYIP